MKIILLLCLLVAVLHAQDKRLIQFNETTTVWMTVEEVEKLAECGHAARFMDITDYPSLDGYRKPKKFAAPSALTQQELAHKIIATLDKDLMLATVTTMSGYQTRYYTTQTGVTSANWLASEYRRHAAAAGRSDVQVEVFGHTWPQPSIIARIIGTSRPNEVVILGGHIDSTAGAGGNNRAPGADDDASGSATCLEVFRVLMVANHFPDRTLEFHGYAAEEVGLRGSQDIAQDYLAKGEDVVCMFQMDMDGYTDGSTIPTIGVVTDWVDPEFTAWLRLLINEYCGNGWWSNTQCGYACSDHASWTRAGFAAVFAFESLFSNSNPYIHSNQDTVARLDGDQMERFASAGVGYCLELSS